MEIVKFDQIENELMNNLQRRMLIPIIGGGFSKGCKSKKGCVPSGLEFKEHMVHEIVDSIKISETEKDDLKRNKFSDVAEIYYSSVDAAKRKEYLENNFSRVIIENYKKDFLSIEWPYIYTINLDDGIENNSDYNWVILPNKDIYDSVFDNHKCIVKIHGDISYLTTYKDECETLSQTQYVNSLKLNKVILSKIEHDLFYQNIIYVGCSLDDEIDLKSLSQYEKQSDCSTARYFCSVKEPTALEKIKYENFGITHFVVFENYKDIYIKLFDLWEESKKISKNDLDYFKIANSKNLNFDYDKNKAYLLQGKGLLQEKTIIKPCFFISRGITKKLIKNLSKHTIQVLIGNGCSGKSYILADLADRIKNYDVYLFESKNRLNSEAFENLLSQNNSVLIFDSKTLSRDQIETIINVRNTLKCNKNHVIIAADKNDQDLNRVLSLKELKNEIEKEEILQLGLKNKFNSKESEKINSSLSIANLGIFDPKKTIVDNIINISNNLVEKNKFYNYGVKTANVNQIAALIMLAIENKIYSQRATQFDLNNEFELHVKHSAPLIEKELAWNFEKSSRDNSPYKYVVEAEYWLRLKLRQYANDEKHRENIVKAFERIVSTILEINGKPKIGYNDNSVYKEYVLFDNINKIFSTEKNDEIVLIRKIYEELNHFLSVDPNFKHQYAKCYVQSAKKEKDYEKKEKYLNEANRNISEALDIFQVRYNENNNEKLPISIAHAKYTQAVIYCHKCSVDCYKNHQQNGRCIDLLYEAMSSKYNSFEYMQNDTINYDKVVQNTIQKFVLNKDIYNRTSLEKVEKLFTMLTRN